jgi:hypothetical protein
MCPRYFYFPGLEPGDKTHWGNLGHSRDLATLSKVCHLTEFLRYDTPGIAGVGKWSKIVKDYVLR